MAVIISSNKWKEKGGFEEIICREEDHILKTFNWYAYIRGISSSLTGRLMEKRIPREQQEACSKVLHHCTQLILYHIEKCFSVPEKDHHGKLVRY